MQLYNCEGKIMRIKLNEHGRSMVEILGVLVVIGILSIGGMVGYEYAYSTYQVHKIQDVLLKAKAQTDTKRRNSRVTSINRFVKSTLSEYAPDDNTPMVSFEENVHYVDLYKVSDVICKMLFERQEPLSRVDIYLIKPNSIENCTNQENRLVYSFDKVVDTDDTSTSDWTDEPLDSDIPDCEYPRQIIDGICTCASPTIWSDVYNDCICDEENYADMCAACPLPRKWVSGECICADSDKVWDEENNACVCKDENAEEDASGKCILCESPNTYDPIEDKCVCIEPECVCEAPRQIIDNECKCSDNQKYLESENICVECRHNNDCMDEY